MMTVIDYAIIALILMFVLFSFSRGIIAEVIATFRWVVSILGARLMYGSFSELTFGFIEPLWARQAFGFSVLFLIFYVILHFFGRILTRFIRFLGLGGMNRFLGIVFGTIKGSMIVTGIIFLCSYTDIINTTMYRDSVLLPYFNKLIVMAAPFTQDMLNNNMDIWSDIKNIFSNIKNVLSK